MNSTMLRVGMLALTALLSSSSAWAASNVIEVKCVDSNGASLNKVKVFLQGLQKDRVKDEECKNGTVAFRKLDDDVYRIWAHHPGYSPVYSEFHNLRGDATKQVTLTFTQGPDENLYFEDEEIRNRAHQLMAEGSQALQSQQFDEAVAKLNESVKINPSEPNTYHNLGVAYIQSGRFDEAEPVLAKAVELINIYNLVRENPQLSAQAADIQGIIDSLPLRKLAEEIDKAMRDKDFATAEVHLKKLIEMQPSNGQAYYTLAIALAQNQNVDESEAAIDKAISLEPGNDSFKLLKSRLGEIRANAERDRQLRLIEEVQKLNEEKKYAEAAAKAGEVIPAVEEKYHGALYAEQTNAYLALEQFDNAIGSYRKSLELTGAAADEGLFELGKQMVNRGKQKEARIAFEEVLEINPEFAEAYYQLGMDTFYELNDKVKAREFLEKYLELGTDEGNRSNAQNVLAVIAMQK